MLRVSSVLELSGLSQPHKAMDPMYRERGRAIHAAAQAIAEGFVAVVDDEHQGYVTAIREWYQRFNPTIVAVERRIVDRTLQLTGRLDLVIVLDGNWCIVDIKTGGPMPHYRYQTALYALLAWGDEELRAKAEDAGALMSITRGAHDIGRAVLYLSNKTGRAKWVPQEDPQDIYIAKAALALLAVRRNDGLLTYVDPEIPDDDAAT